MLAPTLFVPFAPGIDVASGTNDLIDSIRTAVVKTLQRGDVDGHQSVTPQDWVPSRQGVLSKLMLRSANSKPGAAHTDAHRFVSETCATIDAVLSKGVFVPKILARLSSDMRSRFDATDRANDLIAFNKCMVAAGTPF